MPRPPLTELRMCQDLTYWGWGGGGGLSFPMTGSLSCPSPTLLSPPHLCPSLSVSPFSPSLPPPPPPSLLPSPTSATVSDPCHPVSVPSPLTLSLSLHFWSVLLCPSSPISAPLPYLSPISVPTSCWLKPRIHSNYCCCGSWHLLPHPVGRYFWHCGDFILSLVLPFTL